jgi:hypothetical protein
MSIQNRNGLNLNQPVRVDQALNLHGSARNGFPGEIFPPDLRDGLNVSAEIRGIDVQLHHVIEGRTGSFQAFLDVPEHLSHLGFDITPSYHAPIAIHRRLTGDINLIPDSHHMGKSGTGIPIPFGLDNFSRHISSFEMFGRAS